MPDSPGQVLLVNEGSYLNARRIRGGPDGLVVVGSPALERVMAAGIDLFYESGFLATTIRAITGACGLTAPAYYNHFESKEALLYSIISDANSVLETQLDKLNLESVEPSEALQMLVKVLVEFNLTWPKDARIANREYGFLQPPLRNEVIEHRRRVRSMFELVLGSPGLPRGLLPLSGSRETESTEVRLLAISIINLCIASSDWFRSEGPLSIEAVCDTYCRLALRMARLDEPASLSVLAPDANDVQRFRRKRSRLGKSDKN